MEFNMIPVVVLLLELCCVIDSTTGDCVQNLHGDGDYEKCKKRVVTFTQEQKEKKLSMCSMEGQEMVGCWLMYATVCPDILHSPGPLDGEPLSPALQLSLAQLPSAYSQVCPAIEECAAIKACLDEGEVARPHFEEGPTPLTTLPTSLDLMCNMLYPKIKCLNGLRNKCPDQVGKLEQSMLGNITQQEATSGTGATMYSMMQAYLREECTNIPPLFSNNVCFNMKLKSKKFVNCYKSAEEMYTNVESCLAFDAIRKCIEDSMLVCGRAKLRAFVRGAHLMKFHHGTCEFETDKAGGSGGSGGIYGSVAIISFLLLLLLADK